MNNFKIGEVVEVKRQFLSDRDKNELEKDNRVTIISNIGMLGEPMYIVNHDFYILETFLFSFMLKSLDKQ